MRSPRLLVVALLAAACSLTGMSPASAHTRAPEVGGVSSYVLAHGPRSQEVTIRGSYRCWGDSSKMHLWVSAKQGGNNLPGEGSGARAKAWYDTNISHDTAVVCNGRWQDVSVDLGKYPDKQYIQDKGAWVQFCLVSPQGIVASKSRWSQVVGASS